MTAFALSAAVRMALAGTMAVSGDVASITTVPISLTLGTSTPEQIGVRATWNTTRTAGTLARLQYKLPASGTWTDGPFLSEFLASEVLEIGPSSPGSGGAGAESGLAVADGFGGFAYHLAPGTTYDVRLAVFVPAAATAYTASQSYTTRALPAVLPAANKTCTPATLTASLAGLVAGDHLQLQAGTYPPFTVAASGTSGSPIYLSCAVGASVVYATADKIITVNGSDIVFDAMAITGTGVDSERAFMLAGGSMAGVYSTAFYSASVATQRVTVRNSTITGVDIFAKLWAQSDQWLIYNNTITGNNLHDVQYTIPPGDTYPRAGWNDTCINWHGLGNCAFNNTIQGFGDTVKFGFSTAPNGFECRWNHFYRNKVLRAADDGIEFDNAASGSSYRNYFANVGTLASFDGAFEGPFDVFENVCVNAGYGPLKMNGGSSNARFFHNTFVLTVKHGADHGLLTSNVANHYRVKFQNNVVVYRGAGNMVHWSAPLQSGPLFDHNAWYSASDDFFMTSPIYGSAGNLAAAKTTFAPFLAGDVNTTTNPFAATITLGANAQSEYTAGVFDVALAGGASPLNAGVAVPGFNDGFTGAAPTMGAVWGGQPLFYVGEGAPPINISGSNWTPNVDGGGAVLATDFPQLPAAWVYAVTNKIDDLVPAGLYPSGSRYGTLVSGADGLPSIINAWSGAAKDWINGRMYVSGGGHNDSWGTENGVFCFDSNTMRWTLPVARGAYTDARYWDIPTTSVITGEHPSGNNYPQGNGGPPAMHTYHSINWVPGTRFGGNTDGYFIQYAPGNVSGTLCIADLDTGAWKPAWWKNEGSSPKDFSYANSFVEWPYLWSMGLGPTSYFYAERFDLSATESTTYNAASQGQELAFAQGFNMAYGDRAFCKMEARGEVVNFGNHSGALVIHRYRLDDAVAASATANVASYEDTITLTGDTGDFTAAAFSENTAGSRGMLWEAGMAHDVDADCLWMVPNASGSATYKITGLNGTTWTVTKYASGATLQRSPVGADNGTFGRLMCHKIGGIRFLVRVSSTTSYTEVRRCPDN